MASIRTIWPTVIAAGVSLAFGLVSARANPALVVDVDSGEVLYQEMATTPWFPASLTKLMTVYVALSAVREGRITLDTPLMVSPRAAVMPPSKMGFRPGTLVTLDNALKMLMVKSPNDVAVTIAEGVSGSVEAFANDMNVYATRLGLHESHFVNPNGLPDDRHMSSARDMAMIGRAIYRDFPEARSLFNIGVLAFGRQLINNHNGLLGRYPGVDGMKTGYTCAAGYNVVESADNNGRHLLVVLLGSPSTNERNVKAAMLFDRFFSGSAPGLGRLDDMAGVNVTQPPDMHDTVCGRNRRAAIEEAETEDAAIGSGTGAGPSGGPPTSPNLLPVRTAFEPVRVFIGPVPGWTGRVAQAVGTGSKEFLPAPPRTALADAKPRPVDEGPTPALDAGQAGTPIEAAAQGPLALVGSTQTAPAALAARHLVRGAPSLGLRVPTRRARAKVKSIAALQNPKPAPKFTAGTPAAKAIAGKPVARKQLVRNSGSKPAAPAQK